MPRPAANAVPFEIKLPQIDPKLPAREQAYTVLRDAIIQTTINPGEMISEHKICQAIGASRTPVRDAIARLSEEGLVEVYPQRGSVVAPINLSRVYEGHFVRRTLEGAVLRVAANVWTAENTKEAQAIIKQQICAETASEVLRFDDAFHRYFCDVASLKSVWTLIQSAKSHLDRVRHLAVPMPGNQDAVVHEHSGVLDALSAGDGAKAVTLLEQHLDTVFATIEMLATTHDDIFDDRAA